MENLELYTQMAIQSPSSSSPPHSLAHRLVFPEFEDGEEEHVSKSPPPSDAAHDGANETDCVDVLIARSHYRSALLARFLHQWRFASEEEIRRKHTQELVAGQCYLNKIKFLFFRAWQWEFNAKRYARDSWAVAVNHHKRTTLQKHLQAYRTCVRIRRTRVQVVRMLEYRKFLSLVARYAVKLRVYGRQRQVVRYLQRRAIRGLVVRTLTKWSCFVETRGVNRVVSEHEANLHALLKEESSEHAHIADAFSERWNALLQEKDRYDALVELLRVKRTRFALNSTWHHWLLRTRAIRSRRLNRLRLVYRTYQKWQAWARLQVSLSRCEVLAKTFHDKCILERWRHAAAKARAERDACDAAASSFTRRLLKRTLGTWRRNVAEAKAFRASFEAAQTLRSKLIFNAALDRMLVNASNASSSVASSSSSPRQQLLLLAPSSSVQQADHQVRAIELSRAVPFEPSPFRHGASTSRQQQEHEQDQERRLLLHESPAPQRALFTTPQTLPKFQETIHLVPDVGKAVKAVGNNNKSDVFASFPWFQQQQEEEQRFASPTMIEDHINRMLSEFEVLSASGADDKQRLLDVKRTIFSEAALTPEQRVALNDELRHYRDRVDRRLYLRCQLEGLQEQQQQLQSERELVS